MTQLTYMDRPTSEQMAEIQAKQAESQRYSQLAQQLMASGQRDHNSWGDVAATLVNAWSATKMQKKADESAAEYTKRMLEAQRQQEAIQKQQEAERAKAEREAKFEDFTRKEQWKLDHGKGGAQGAFAGTGIEAQMLNIVLDPTIPQDDPRKKLAMQRLQRETTISTPQGTYVNPGYDLDALNGQQAAPGPQPVQPESAGRFIEKPQSDGEKLASGFYERMTSAQSEIDQLLSEVPGYSPVKGLEPIRGASNLTASPEYQRYRQAASDWIRAKLRKESGAAIGDQEMAQEYETYFPVVGDSAEVIEQKARARRQAEAGMLRSAGQGYKPTSEGESTTVNWSDL